MLNVLDRLRSGQQALPWLTCVDSQSVHLAPNIFERRGLDGDKCVKGRKRQILTDSAGRIWSAHVHAAHQHDSGCGPTLLLQRSWGG
ncbi:transposase (plasmid) [Hymenobacter sp. NBH84]|uniref:transposase n=1 Tax=Hymenobacter sp. NBH84 TaxID=2596915 RepID=UPI001627C08E|nr:transposase [Hymenobacter sp. NBH84]QNE41914.1 transposase [Hymenobacter sp. NBH84]